MKFVLKADTTFEADNMDDALKKLGKHFLATFSEGLDAPDIILSGEIQIYPLGRSLKNRDSFCEKLIPEK